MQRHIYTDMLRVIHLVSRVVEYNWDRRFSALTEIVFCFVVMNKNECTHFLKPGLKCCSPAWSTLQEERQRE